MGQHAGHCSPTALNQRTNASIGPRVRQPSPHPFSDPSPLKLRNRSQESHLQAPSVAAILPFGWFPVADVSADMSVG